MIPKSNLYQNTVVDNVKTMIDVNKDSHDAYDRPDLNALLSFEDKHFGSMI